MHLFAADLHNHTPASADHLRPETSAREIVEAALDAGLHVYAVTDHFSCAFAGALLSAADHVAAETGRHLLIVPGAELRVTFQEHEAHLTALFDPVSYQRLFPELMGLIGRKPPYAAREELPFLTVEHDPVEVARIIHALGGIACVSHADRPFGGYRLIDTPLFTRLAAEPSVFAIDLLDPQREGYRLPGVSASLIRCSDSHSCERIGARRTIVAMEALTFASLKRALANGTVVPETLV
ncbi:MAG: PHP domain-containing protein [Clostridiales bacterium]|nr:PHP domain-containing protein [Clostridiales bacterium]